MVGIHHLVPRALVSRAVILSPAVDAYLAGLRAAPDDVLAEMEAHADRDGIPIVQPETGALLHVLALASGARRIVEVGTAIGVSTLYLARALPEDGVIVSFEVDEGRHRAARDYLTRAGVADRADLRLEDARAGLAGLDGPFDLAFIDAAKLEYDDYLAASLPLVRPRGIVVIDNVLMGGTVAENAPGGPWGAESIASARALNERLIEDDGLAVAVTPVGDGVAIAVKL